MSLQRKLVLALIVPALVLGTVGGVGVSSLYRLARAVNEILSDNYESIQDARRMERILRALEDVSVSRAGLDAAGNDILELAREFTEALSRCESNITEDGEAKVLQDVRELWEQISPGLVSQGAESITIMNKTGVVSSLYGRIDALVDMNEQAMFGHEHETLRSARTAVGVMGMSLLVALAVLTLFARMAARRISRPILLVADNLHDTLKTYTLADTEWTLPGNEIERLDVELANLLKRLALYENEQTGKVIRLQGRLAFVMEEVREGLVLVDKRLDILDLNKTARRVLGVKIELPMGHNLGQLHLNDEVRHVLLPVLDTDLDVETSLAYIRCRIDEAERIYQPRVLPLTSDEGKAEGYLIVFWDVTEEQRLEESRRSFIAMLSHQLKTPVTSLAMSVNLLWERFQGQAQDADELLSMAREDCSSLAGLVDELVGAARDMTSNLALRLTRIDVVRLVRESLRPLFIQARDRGIDLRDQMGSAPVFIKGDPIKLPWVITNLVGNALRYTPSDGSITVDIEAVERRVSISVSDTGAGISREDMKRIFLPSTSQDGDSQRGLHGLGLVIAKEIVEAHDGSIDVQSELGAGTTFTVLLPTEMGEFS